MAFAGGFPDSEKADGRTVVWESPRKPDDLLFPLVSSPL